jgi:hypothetical protein
MTRRSLSETLSPEESQFLQGGKPERESKKATKKESLQTSLEEEGAITVTFRLPPSLLKMLQRTSLERKLARQKPYSQQEIVTEAIREWLGKHGQLLA